MRHFKHPVIFVLARSASLILAFLLPAEASATAMTASQLEQVTLLPRTGHQLSLALPLTDEFGITKPLEDWLGNVPTVWIAADYTCKTLCGPTISIVSSALADTGLKAVVDYRLIVFGLDPKDTAADAREMKRAQAGSRTDLAGQSTFLRAAPADLVELLATFGIEAVYDVERDQFAHPDAAFVVTREGRISRALSGIAVDPGNLRLALVDASRGSVGSWSDQALLLCYGFDPATGVYTFAIWRMLTGAVVITMVALIALVGLLIRRGAVPKPS